MNTVNNGIENYVYAKAGQMARFFHVLLILLIGSIGINTFTSCSSDGGDGDSSSSVGDGESSSSVGGGWPANANLAHWGLDGSPLPAEITVSDWVNVAGMGMMLSFSLNSSSDPSDAIDSWLTDNGWTLDSEKHYSKDNLTLDLGDYTSGRIVVNVYNL